LTVVLNMLILLYVVLPIQHAILECINHLHLEGDKQIIINEVYYDSGKNNKYEDLYFVEHIY